MSIHEEASTANRPEDDYPPTHRRRWRWWMEPGFALDEWRELTVLAEDLRQLSEHVDALRRSMGPGLRSVPLERYARTLKRMGGRWQKRAEIAKRDAIKDASANFEWVEARETTINEDLAVSFLSGAANELREAEKWLGRDPQTQTRVNALREEAEAIALEVNNRDLTRRLRVDY